jgi:hypothetical protein
MTADEHTKMFDELSHAKMRKDFVPFTIVLHDGRQFEVEDRWHVGFAVGNPVVVIHSPRLGHHVAFKWDDVAAIRLHERAA